MYVCITGMFVCCVIVGQVTSDFCATNVKLLRPAELETSQQGTDALNYFELRIQTLFSPPVAGPTLTVLCKRGLLL